MRATTTTYTAATRACETRTPANRPTWVTVNPQGRPTRLETPLVTPVTLTNDRRGRVVSVAQGARVTTTTYDVTTGHQLSRTDALGWTALSERDALGRVLREVLPDGDEVQYGGTPAAT